MGLRDPINATLHAQLHICSEKSRNCIISITNRVQAADKNDRVNPTPTPPERSEGESFHELCRPPPPLSVQVGGTSDVLHSPSKKGSEVTLPHPYPFYSDLKKPLQQRGGGCELR